MSKGKDQINKIRNRRGELTTRKSRESLGITLKTCIRINQKIKKEQTNFYTQSQSVTSSKIKIVFKKREVQDLPDSMLNSTRPLKKN
jgi:hypothetical protein